MLNGSVKEGRKYFAKPIKRHKHNLYPYRDESGVKTYKCDKCGEEVD